MYIEPNTNIRILKGVPVDSDYVNTIFFSDKSTQANYFIGLTKYNLANYTYQRVNRGVIRVDIQAENLYDCNYLMFKNNIFGDKWFYAFIDKIEYVNNSMSEVYFTIDVMQTWMCDYTMNQSFVEREHSVTDVAGENLVPENVNLGEYVISDIEQPLGWNSFEKCIVIGSTDWWDGDADNPTWHNGTGAGLVGGVFCGVHFQVFSGGNETGRVNNASTYLQKFADEGLTDSILGVWETYQYYVTNNGYGDEIHTSRPLTINGYKPKNKKLLTFPYCFLEGASGDGNRHTYMYEFFENPADIKFNIKGTFNGTASLGMYPRDYKGASPNYDEIMAYDTASIQCAYTTDSFKAWLAQNSYNLHLPNGNILQLPKNTIGNLTGGFNSGARVGGETGGLVGMSVGAVSTIADILQKESVTPNQGRLGSGSAINHLLKLDIFRVNKKAITREFAVKIDDYFNRFGYQTNNVKVPNRNSRPHWNYVKTVGCSIKGSIPADDKSLICRIYDNGITFWKNGSEVGDYSLDNSPS